MAAKLFVFDLDGTLLLTGGAGIRAINRLFWERYGVKDAMERVEGRGVTDPKIFEKIFKLKLNRAPHNGELKELISVYPRYLRPEVKTSPGYRVSDGIYNFLKRLRKIPGIYLALGTGNLERTARIKLARARLNRFFPVGGFATDSFERKRLLDAAWRKARRHYKTAFKKRDVYVIGDTPRDVEAGKACGFKTVAVSCGMFGKKRLLTSRPDYYFDGFSKPERWFKELKIRGDLCD